MTYTRLDYHREQYAKSKGITLQEYKDDLEKTNQEFKEWLKSK